MAILIDPKSPEISAIQKRTLELQQYATVVNLGQTAAQSLSVEYGEDFATRSILERISLSILRDKIVDDSYKARYRYKVYTSWWQHFKADYMPKWFVKRYPVQQTQKSGYVTVKFTRYAEYPKANIALQKDRKFFEVQLGGTEVIKDTVEQYPRF